jgi:hypothetical protein
MGFADTYNKLFEKIKRLAATSTPFDERTSRLPVIPDDSVKLSTFIEQLFDDAKKWREQKFVNRHGQTDPIVFWQRCHLLETGQHWEVWGRRVVDVEKDGWKSELIDDEISNQIRVKTAYLTANYHSFDVLPNIANINEIIFQDQQKTGWSRNIIETTKRMCTFGSAISKSIMDYDADPMGIATEVLCDNATILLSPGAMGIKRKDGCWYVIHATIQPIWRVLGDYKDDIEKLGVNTSDIEPANVRISEDVKGTANYFRANAQGLTYQHTQSTDVLETWMDDFTLIDTPYDEREAMVEHQATLQGQRIPTLPDQNHKLHVESHLAFLAELNAQQVDEGVAEQRQAINSLIGEHIEQHLQYRMDGKERKYPYGRQIVRAGGVIVRNIGCPFEFDWHKIFHWVDFESAVGQVWGRGLVEILWESNKTIDLMLSRIADLGLASVGKPWVNIATKRLLDENPLNNDPTEPAYYEGMPPVWPQGSRAPIEFTQVLKLMKDNSARSQGIGDVTYGATPTPGASNDLAETLLRQNAILVTGEANTNLMEYVAEVIETRLLFMRQLYKQPRRYHIAGTYQQVVVSDILQWQLAIDPESGEILIDPQTQGPVREPIPLLEVKIKPNSNLPNQWEIDLAVALKLMQVPNEDGVSIIPSQAVTDILAERYPQFGPSGKYHRIVKTTQIGKQAIEAQQQAQQAQEEMKPDVKRIIKSVREKRIKDELNDKANPQSTEGAQ